MHELTVEGSEGGEGGKEGRGGEGRGGEGKEEGEEEEEEEGEGNVIRITLSSHSWPCCKPGWRLLRVLL